MDINAGIIDQRLQAVREEICERASSELGINDGNMLKSLAFVHLVVKTVLDLDSDEAFDCLTEGSQDFGVDAIHISAEQDGEFVVSLFQCKYKHNNLDGVSSFPETGIEKLINAVKHLFNPSSALENINLQIKVKVEEIRSLIRDGYIPQVSVLACNNGQKWNSAANEAIERSLLPKNQVTWEHINHNRLVGIMQAVKPVNDTLQLKGKAIVEDFNFSRVMVARIPVWEIADLIERHGERLLERNIRRYLGLYGNRVNEAIYNTLKNEKEQANFYFYNNGITFTCSNFTHNALQDRDYQVKIENLQIINGGQTCITIHKTLKNPGLFEIAKDAHVLIRLYQLPEEKYDLVSKITYATNSQNPVDMRDLKSNDERQRRLEIDIEQLGYKYRRKRSDITVKASIITPAVAAEAILSVWREKPHQAKFFRREHFGKLYDQIFSENLNGAQTIIAALLYRIAENRRKRPTLDKLFLPYSSCFIAMQMGKYLLQDMQCDVSGINHQNFKRAKEFIITNEDSYFERATKDIEDALGHLYGSAEGVSIQQLAATFRRGDLIELLK